MALTNQIRNVNGETSLRVFATKGSEEIDVGDLCWYDATNKYVRPASAFAWNTTLAQTQVDFKKVYAGVSQDYATSTDSAKNIMVSTTGVVDYPIADNATAQASGTFYGPAKASGNALLSQQLDVAANATGAIGKLSKPGSAHATHAQVDHVAAVTLSGVQTIT